MLICSRLFQLYIYRSRVYVKTIAYMKYFHFFQYGGFFERLKCIKCLKNDEKSIPVWANSLNQLFFKLSGSFLHLCKMDQCSRLFYWSKCCQVFTNTCFTLSRNGTIKVSKFGLRFFSCIQVCINFLYYTI